MTTGTARSRGPGIGLIGVGVAFLAIGISGQRAFIAIGIAFLVIGIAALARAARSS